MPSMIQRQTPAPIDTIRSTLADSQAHHALDSPISPLTAHSLSPNPSLLSVSPGPSPATSPSMSAQVHSVQEDMTEKMLLNESKTGDSDTRNDSPTHTLSINTHANNKHSNPLQTLLSAAVPSPSNATNHSHNDSRPNTGRSGRPLTQSLRVSVTPIINPVTTNNGGNVRSFLHQSPTGSPGFHNSHSPFMSLSAMSPLTPITTTTASTSSASSAPHGSQGHGHGLGNDVITSQQHSGSALPVSPLSVWTPNIPSSNPILTGGISTASFANTNTGLSAASIQAQYDLQSAAMFHELDALFPMMVKTGSGINNDSARLDDSTKWLNRAIPLSAKPLRHLANACRVLLDMRKVVLSTALHVAHMHKTMNNANNGLPMPPSLFDNEVTQLFNYVVSDSYWRSHQLKSLQSIIRSVLAHAYKRSTSTELPLRTNPEDDVKNDPKADSTAGTSEARMCQSCCDSAEVSVVFSCHHTQCWSCLGKTMITRDSPCHQCNTSWLVQRDSAVLDENEALLLASQYLQSSYSLPTQSPQQSPLLHSHPSPPLLEDEMRDSKKRKISAITGSYEAPTVSAVHHQAPMNNAAFHHATSSAFSRRVANIYTGHGASSPIPGVSHHGHGHTSSGNLALSPQFGSSSPLPGQYPIHGHHQAAWSPAPGASMMSTHSIPSQFSLIPSTHAQHIGEEQSHYHQRQHFHPHPHANTAPHPLNITVTGPALLSSGIPSMPSPQLQYGFVDVHGNTYPSYPHYSQPIHAGHGYTTMPQYITAYQQATPIPTATATAAAVQPIDPQMQALIKRELKVKKERKVKEKTKKKKKRSKKSESDSGSGSDSDNSNASDNNNDSPNDHDADDDGASGALSGQIYPFLCRVPNCNDSFKTRFSLKRHMKKHTGQKPFSCEYPQCRKQFAEKSTLKRHLRIHTGEKPYQCSVPGCGKMFADRTNVKRHEMIHSGERPYWCTQPGCKRGYFWRKHLKKHLLSVHGVVQPTQEGLGNHPSQTLALQSLAINFAHGCQGQNDSDDESSAPSSAEDSEEEERPVKKERKRK